MMVNNDLKIALRTLKRNKLYTTINVFGLSIGLAAAILILLHIRFEFSYDDFHQHREKIYRLSIDHLKEGKSIHHSPATMRLPGSMTGNPGLKIFSCHSVLSQSSSLCWVCIA
ncbi:hypothetical protein GF406_08960 [candidate division KSB1 bacterium]|nr:hypothetical protein [candidate division KSB1 bacterium]